MVFGCKFNGQEKLSWLSSFEKNTQKTKTSMILIIKKSNGETRKIYRN